MLISEQTRRKLDRLSVELKREFAHVPGERVEAAFRTVVDDLLSRARFEDFIPLLAHRNARNELLVAPVEAESAEAAEALEAVGG
jgi:hypothetical protein